VKTTPFKVCPNCEAVWQTMDDFLADPEMEQAGYQVNFVDLKGGLFYFTHHRDGCGTTLAIPVGKFTSLSARTLLAARGEQPGGKCPGSCVRKGDMDPCPVECECVWVREVMQVIKERKTA